MPKRALTAVGVERIKPPARGQVEIFDRGYPGFALRVSCGGGKAWSMFYRLGGKLRRLTLGLYPAMGLAEAREAWREKRKLVAMGQDPAQSTIKTGDTVASVIEDWLKRDKRNAKASSLYQTRSAINRDVLPVWNGRLINTISKRDVIELLDGIIDRGAPGKARSVHAHLHRFFKWAVGREIIPISPMDGLECPVTANRRDRVLSDGELLKVWRSADDGPFGDILKLLILTGARREEITQLRWLEIVGDTISLPGERTKTGEPRLIPLSGAAMALLKSAPRNGCDFVFTADGKRPVNGWSRAKRRLDAATKINQPWVIHDIRRTVATGCQKLGINLQTVEAILGHTGGSRGGIVKVYQVHDYAAEKRAALEAWGDNVMALVEGAAPRA
jgi:integrase